MKKILLGIILAIALILWPMPVQAATDFSVVPSKVELSAEAGKSVEKKITVANTGKTELEISTEVQDYTITENNEFIYYPAGELKYSAAQWISVDKQSFTLAPGGKTEITITFSAPAGVDPRGYQSILFVSAQDKKSPQKEGAAVGIVGRIGVVLLGEVNPPLGGEVSALKREGEIKDMKLEVSFPPFIQIKNGGLSVDFKGLYRPEVKAVTSFKNTGLTHLTLGGQTRFLSKFFGFAQTVDLQEITTLPDSLRNLEATWQKPVFFGPITANASLTWEGGPKLEKSVSAFVIPWNLIWVLLVLIIIIVLVIWGTVRRHLRHKKLQAMMEELLKHEEEDKAKARGKGKKAKAEPVFQEVREELEEVKEKKHPGWRYFGWALLFVAVIISAALIGYALAQLFSEGGLFKQAPTATLTSTPTEEVISPTETPTLAETPTETGVVSPTVTTTILTGETYTVQSGDTLLGIAQKFGISDWHEIAELNGITDPTSLHPGDVLKIPKK